mgnify:CR=1 FL=1
MDVITNIATRAPTKLPVPWALRVVEPKAKRPAKTPKKIHTAVGLTAASTSGRRR